TQLRPAALKPWNGYRCGDRGPTAAVPAPDLERADHGPAGHRPRRPSAPQQTLRTKDLARVRTVKISAKGQRSDFRCAGGGRPRPGGRCGRPGGRPRTDAPRSTLKRCLPLASEARFGMTAVLATRRVAAPR